MVTIDTDALRRRLAPVVDRQLSGARIADLRPTASGASSLTLLADLRLNNKEPATAIVKVAPPGLAPTLNRDVLRQSRILKILGDAGFRVPTVLFEDEGDPPTIPPLFGMQFVRGDCLEPILDPDVVLPAPDEIEARACDAARTLAELHLVPRAAVAGAGEAPVDLNAEISRWERLLATIPEEIGAGFDKCAAALKQSLPNEEAAVVVHGDYRLGNMLCDGGSVRAVIDWEIWSVGDPRIDLAWLLMMTHPSRHPSAVRVAPGMPSAETLLAEYETTAQRKVESIEWFDAAARFKLSGMIGQIVKHNRRRPDPDPRLEASRTQIPTLFAEILAAVG